MDTAAPSAAFSTPLFDSRNGHIRYECNLCDDLCTTKIGADSFTRVSRTVAALEAHLQDHAVCWALDAIEATR